MCATHPTQHIVELVRVWEARGNLEEVKPIKVGTDGGVRQPLFSQVLMSVSCCSGNESAPTCLQNRRKRSEADVYDVSLDGAKDWLNCVTQC